MIFLNVNFKDDKRFVLPRWRDYNIAVESRELTMNFKRDLATSLPLDQDNSIIYKKKDEWERFGGIAYANDLVNSALIFNCFETAKEAAQYILSLNTTSEISKKQARIILGDELIHAKKNLIQEVIPNTKDYYDRIHYLKNIFANDYNNSIVCTDLARAYAIVGQIEKAKKYIKIALNISPENRFVVRSAASLFIHLHELDRAHFYLKRSPYLKVDPWLLATEISLLSMCGKTSNNMKAGLNSLNSTKYSDFQLSELLSVIGTIEFNNGDIKNAKKLFVKSLIDPNENTLAQAVWIKPHIPSLNILSSNVPFSFEAESLQMQQNKKWEESLRQAYLWIKDLPYLSRPIIFASFLSASIFEDYNQAKNISEYGLIANPNDCAILNNLAYSSINLGKIEDAENYLHQVQLHSENYMGNLLYTATSGLLNFRKGQFDIGRQLYNNALFMTQKKYDINNSALVAINYANEEIQIHSEYMEKIYSDAIEICAGTDDPSVQVLLDRLKNKYNQIKYISG